MRGRTPSNSPASTYSVESKYLRTSGSTNTQAVISTSGILLPDSGGTPSAIDDSKWKLNVTITRVF